MAWKNLFLGRSRRSPVFEPFSNDYFTKRLARQRELLARKPLYQVGDYVVVEEHAGGMSEVLIGRNSENRLVALKSIKAMERVEDSTLESLAEEASKLIGLRVAFHLVPEDVVPDYPRQSFLIALPYCAGGSLADRAKAGPVPIEEIIYYAFVIAGELANLHDERILHLDLKPSNILFQSFVGESASSLWRWRPVVSDYGLATYRAGGAPALGTGGTPLFMAPEQILGLPVETHTDLWGYGATFYYLVTGQPALGSVWPLDASFESQCVRPLHELAPGCPTWFSEAIGLCLALSPNQRLAQATTLLDIFLANLRVEATNGRGVKVTAGVEADQAALTIRDPYLVDILDWRDKTEGESHLAIFDLGWPQRAKDAYALFQTFRPGPTRKALRLVDEVLGHWEQAGSILWQFAKAPHAAAYDPPKPARGKNWRDVKVNAPLPLEALWELLDLRCMCLTSLVDDLALSSDVHTFKETSTRWLATGSYGGQRASARSLFLCRMAQGFFYSGENEVAAKLLSEAWSLDKNDLTVLSWMGMVQREIGDYKLALGIFNHAIDVACDANRHDRARQLTVEAIDVLTRMGQLDAGIQGFQNMLANVQSEDVWCLMQQLLARRAMVAELSVLREAIAHLERTTSIEVWLAVGEVAYWAREVATLSAVLNALDQDPRLHLASSSYHRRLATALAENKPGSPFQVNSAALLP